MSFLRYSVIAIALVLLTANTATAQSPRHCFNATGKTVGIVPSLVNPARDVANPFPDGIVDPNLSVFTAQVKWCQTGKKVKIASYHTKVVQTHADTENGVPSDVKAVNVWKPCLVNEKQTVQCYALTTLQDRRTVDQEINFQVVKGQLVITGGYTLVSQPSGA